MENLNNSNDTRCKVTFMNPLLKIDIYGYTHQQTMQLLNTIITVDNSRSQDPSRETFGKSDFKISPVGNEEPTTEKNVLVDEGNPLPLSTVVKDRTPEKFTGEDTHGEGGLFKDSFTKTNPHHKPEEH